MATVVVTGLSVHTSQKTLADLAFEMRKAINEVAGMKSQAINIAWQLIIGEQEEAKMQITVVHFSGIGRLSVRRQKKIEGMICKAAKKVLPDFEVVCVVDRSNGAVSFE